MSTLVHTERPTVVIEQAMDSIAANLEVNDGRPIVVVSQMPGDVLSVSMEQRGATLTLGDDASLVAAYSTIASNSATYAQASATAAANSAAQADIDQIIVAADRLTVEALRQATSDDRDAVAFMATDVANDRDNVQLNTDQVAQDKLDVTDMRDLVSNLTDEVAADHALVILARDQVNADAAQVSMDKTDVAADRDAVQLLHDATEDNAQEVGVNLDAVTTLAAQVATNTTLTQSNTDQVEQHRTDVYAARTQVDTARDEVEADRVAVEASQAQVSTDAAQVASDRVQVSDHRTAVEGFRDEVEADRAEVELNRTDIQAMAAQVLLHNNTVQANADQVASDRTDVLNAKTAVDSAAAQTATNLTQSTSLADQVSQDASQVAADRIAVTNHALDVSTDTATVSALALQVQNDRTLAQTAALEASESAFDVQIDRAEVETLAAQVTLNASQSQSNANAAASSEANALTYANLSEAAKDAAESAAAAASGGLKPLGNWDASGGTAPPAPTDSTVPWYRISVAGTVSGVGAVEVGDNIYWDVSSTGWFKIDNTEKFTSINGFTSGVVTLNAGHVGAIPASKEGPGNGLNADLLDGQHGTHYLDFNNATNKPSPSLTLQGDVSGTTSFLGLASTIMNVTVANDSHDHSFSTITGLQAALDAKQPILTGAASTIASSNLTTNRALTSNGSGKVAVSAVTATELGYLSGTTSSVQTQINAKANTADLGTAATKDVTASATDTTAGRLMQTGDAGWLGTTGNLLPGANADALIVSGVYATGIAWTGSIAAGSLARNQGTLIHIQAWSGGATYATQTWQRMQENELWIRHKNAGIWSSWVQMYHTGNFTPGTAASTDTTTSSSDNTSGRVLRVDHANAKYLGLSGGTLTGALTATSFSGAGTALTALNPANITTTASFRFVTDTQITTWNAKADSTTSVLAGNGLTGGGTLAANRTLTLGTPGTLTGSTTNAVTASSHTHAITVTKADVGLGSVDNTSDAAKPVSTATQAALNGKQATVTGAATTIVTSNLTASRALVSDGSGKVGVSAVTATELGYLGGVTSNIQTQFNSLSTSASWGNISGTLANQTDLQNVLNGKLNTAGGTMTGRITTDSSIEFISPNGSAALVSLVNVGSNDYQLRWSSYAPGPIAGPIKWGLYDGTVYRTLTTSGNTLSYGGNDLIHASSPQLTSKLDKTGGTVTGLTVFSASDINLVNGGAGFGSGGVIRWEANNGAHQAADPRPSASNQAAIHWYGRTNTPSDAPIRWNLYDGSTYRLLTTSGDTLSYGGNDLQHAGSAQYARGNTGSSSPSFTLSIGIANRIVRCGSGVTVTIPANSSVAFPVGTVIGLYTQLVASGVTIARASGVTLRLAADTGSDANRSLAPGTCGRLTKITTDEWVLTPNVI